MPLILIWFTNSTLGGANADWGTFIFAVLFTQMKIYGERAKLANGQKILELGCGWGSLSLWMAATYPKQGFASDITHTFHLFKYNSEVK